MSIPRRLTGISRDVEQQPDGGEHDDKVRAAIADERQRQTFVGQRPGPNPTAARRTGGRKYLQRIPARSNIAALTAANSRAVPTSGSRKIKPSTMLRITPGTTMP